MSNCPCCNHPLHSFVQTSIVRGKPARTYCECHNPRCQMYMQTLTADQYQERCREIRVK